MNRGGLALDVYGPDDASPRRRWRWTESSLRRRGRMGDKGDDGAELAVVVPFPVDRDGEFDEEPLTAA